MATSTVSVWQNAINGLNEFILTVGQSAELQTRSIKPPNSSGVDYDEDFIKFADIVLALDTGDVGKTTFDGVGVEQPKTHDGFFEWIEDVTSELWVLYLGRRFKILTVEDIGELNGIIKLEMLERGVGEASKA